MKTTDCKKRCIFLPLAVLRTVTPHSMDTKTDHGSLRTGLSCFHIGDTVHSLTTTKKIETFSVHDQKARLQLIPHLSRRNGSHTMTVLY